MLGGPFDLNRKAIVPDRGGVRSWKTVVVLESNQGAKFDR